jgi:hypothetical protein
MASPVIIDGSVRESRVGPIDLFRSFGPNVYRAAAEEGVNLSVYLEAQDPSSDYRDGMDAYERLLDVAGVRTVSRPAIGVYASEMGAFAESPAHRSLLPEFIHRTWRAVKFGGSASTRALYTSSDDIAGSSLRPYADSAVIGLISPVAPPFSLSDIVAMTTPITGAAYRKVYLNTTASGLRRHRVVEGTDIPLGKLTTADHTINLYKYAGGLKTTYEALRRTRIDKVRLWLAQEALRNEIDKISEAINVLVSGDGNTTTAADAYQAKTDFDSTATGKTVTLKAWWNFHAVFAPYFTLTHVVGVRGDIAKLALLNIGTSNVPVYMVDPRTRASTRGTLADGTVYGITTDVPADKLVGLDASQALERVTEVGSNIEEIERWAQQQVEILTISEVEAWAVLTQGATKTLELES